MPEVDSLSLKIKAAADDAIKSLDTLIGKLDSVKGALKIGGTNSNISTSMQNVTNSLNEVDKQVKKTARNMKEQFNAASKDIAKGYRYEGTFEGVQKQLSKYTNALESAKIRVQELEAAGRTGGGEFQRAISNLNKYSNMVEGLKKQLQEMNTFHPQTAADISINRETVQNLKDATEEAQRFGRELGNDAYAGRDIVAEVEAIQNKLEGANKSAQAFKMPFISDKLTDAARSAMSFSDILKKLKVTNTSAGLEKVDEAIKKTKEQYRQLGEQIRIAFEHNQKYGNTAAFDRQQIKIEQLQNQYRDLILMQRQLAQEQPYERVRNGFETIGKSASSAVGSVRSLASRLAGVVKHAINVRTASKQLQNATRTLTKSLLKASNMLKMMVVRMALRKVIEGVGTGFKGLALYSDEFNRSLSMLIDSLKQLGYSVSAMVSPLVNAFAPALNQLIQLAIQAVNYINQLFSALTGKGTWIRAKKQTDDYAKSLSGAGKAAKGALRSFDELKVISTDKGGSGGGSAEINPGDMFETVDIESRILNLSDKIKEAWDKADFTEIGTMLGTKINEGLERIDWVSIQGTAGRIGKSIGTFITGFAETPDLGKNIGKSIAGALNTAVNFVYEFITNTNWKSVGNFIGDTIAGFFEDVDTEKIGLTISETINGIFDLFNGTIEEIDWEEAGKKIVDFVDGVVSGIDESKIVETLDNLTQAFIGLTGSVGNEIYIKITGEEVDLSWAEQLDEIQKSFEDGSWKDALKLWSDDISEAFGGADKWVRKVSLAINTGGISTMIDYAKKAKEKTGEVMTSLKGMDFSGWFQKASQWFSLGRWTLLGNNIKTSITTEWNEFVTWFNGTGVAKWWNNITQKFSTATWATFGNNIKTSLTNKWNQFTTWFNNTGFATWWHGVQSKFSSNAWNFSGIRNGLSTAWNNAISSIKQIWNLFASWINGKLKFSWDALEIAGKKIVPSGSVQLGKFPTFAQGGFPEDGWFRASKGEYLGMFDDGTSYVANNNQVSDAMAQMLYPAVYNAVSSALQNNKDLIKHGDTKVYVGTREITDVVIDNITDRTIKNQKTPFPIMG